MKNYFPAQGKGYTYFQTNRSDDLGSLWSSMGLDFQSNLGTMRVAPRLRVNTSTTDDADLGLPTAFANVDTCFWAICGSRIFKTAASAQPDSAFTEDASSGAVTTYDATGDLAVFNSLLWSTAAGALYSKALDGGGTGAWTSRDTYSTAIQHPLVNFAKFNRLYYQGNGGQIRSIDTSNVVSTTGDYTLTIPSGAQVSCMKATSTFIWIGVSFNASTTTPPAYILQWDGISAQATNKYLLKSPFVTSIVIDRDIPYCMDGNGALSKYNGSSFDEVGRLPVASLPLTSSYNRKNGIVNTKNNTIMVAVNNNRYSSDSTSVTTSTMYENLPAGVWEWSPDYGFTHRYSVTYNPMASSTITDYGQNRLSAVGALFLTAPITQALPSNGTMFVGATYYTNASSTSSAILIDDSNNTIQKKGYFVTTWFNSQEVEDKWNRLWTTFRRLLGATDSIMFKYRIHEEDPTYASITWVNTTSFTTTTDITAYGPTATGFNGTSGGEVEIIQGTGGASCAHITNIVNNAGTYTVTLDTAITGVTTGTAKARFQKWIKLNPEITGQVLSYKQLAIGANNIRIQIKGCLTFTGDGEFFKLALDSNSDITISP